MAPDLRERVGERRSEDWLIEHHVGARVARAAHERLVVARHDDDARPPAREIVVRGQLRGLPAAARGDDVDALGVEQQPKHFTDVGDVLDEEHPEPLARRISSPILHTLFSPSTTSKADAEWVRSGRALTRPEGRWSTGSLVNTALKRTPLYESHVKAGARMVPFGGWEMPVQYAGIVEEHRAVRAAVGCFDVSHMGEFEVEGPQALASLQRLTTNDVAALEVGQVQYSLLCYPDGGIVDDLTLYRLAPERFMLTVNASNIDKDWSWVREHGAAARWRNVSDDTGLIAAQGPKAEALVGRLADRDVTGIAYYHFAEGRVAGVRTLISRTGYTGEDGFELYVAAVDTPRLWSALLEAGRGDGVVPIGLGARDTLRLEMRYALYGNDIDATTNPLEAGLGWIVKPAKGDFVGRDAIEKVRAAGPRRKLIGLEMADRSVARHGYAVTTPVASPTVGREGAPTANTIGIVTSGSYGPSVERSIAMAYVASAQAAVGTELGVEIRGQVRPARVVKTPFHPSRVKK